MAAPRYRIVFSGKIAAGQNLDEVKQKFAILYKKDVATIERMLFSGKPVVIKGDLEEQAARTMQANLTNKIGAAFDIQPMAPPAAKPASAPKPKAPPAESPPKPAPQITAKQSAGKKATPPPLPGSSPASEDARIGFWPRLAALLVDFDLMMFLAFRLA